MLQETGPYLAELGESIKEIESTLKDTMRPKLLTLLLCPECSGELTWREGGPVGRNNVLICGSCDRSYPITSNGIPRFTCSDDYASSFSFEWAKFSTTQLDSARGWGQSEERFQQSLDFPLKELKDKLVLDAGCGMGRFAEIAAKYGATVVAVDMSYAVDVAAVNLSAIDSVFCIQADLRRLPFRESAFDLIYSLGVLHHTPDPEKAFHSLVRFLKPGGKISVTLYAGYNKIYVTSTNLWRRLTTRLPKEVVYGLARLAIPAYYLYRIPALGLLGQAVFPISMHPDPKWRLLDTFDCYTPTYQSYHTHCEIFQWFRDAGLSDISVLEPGISFIGNRPTPPQ